MKRMSAILLTSVVLMSSHAQAQSVSLEPMQAPKATKYDTRYSSTNSKIVVFDDGQQTYVSLPKEMPTPIVISFVPAGEVLLQPAQMSPYLLLPGLHKKLKFVWGNARDAYVTHTGDSGLDRIGQPASFGAVTPVAVHGAVQKPVSSEIKAQTVIETSASKAPSKAPSPIEEKTVSHTDKKLDSSTSGVVPVVVEADQRTEEPTNIKTWSILPTDGRLATSLERWAKSEGMRLIWDAKRHVMLSSSDSFTGTLTEALQRVLSSPAIRQSDYPLEACIYPNNPPVLRITRLTEQALECPQ